VTPLARFAISSTPTLAFPIRNRSRNGLGSWGRLSVLEVGDRLVVHFRNRAFKAGGNYGMHPHGFRYTKDNEGAHYLPAGAGAEVPPGGQFEYHWLAGDDRGPRVCDSRSPWLGCYSHRHEPQRAKLWL